MKYRQKLMLAGGLAGALVGLAAAFLYIKSNESEIAALEAGETEEARKVSPGEAMTIGLALLGVVRRSPTWDNSGRSHQGAVQTSMIGWKGSYVEENRLSAGV